MIKCLTCGKQFAEYTYQALFWSADLVPTCPYCGTNIYQGDFKTAEDEKNEQ